MRLNVLQLSSLHNVHFSLSVVDLYLVHQRLPCFLLNHSKYQHISVLSVAGLFFSAFTSLSAPCLPSPGRFISPPYIYTLFYSTSLLAITPSPPASPGAPLPRSVTGNRSYSSMMASRFQVPRDRCGGKVLYHCRCRQAHMCVRDTFTHVWEYALSCLCAWLDSLQL